MRLFLDANVIYSTAKSELGASFALFQLERKLNYTFISSRLALVEAERNIIEKENTEIVESFYRLIQKIKIITVDGNKAKKYYKGIIEEKDAPILYGAKQSKAEYLITLDRRHFFTNTIKRKQFPFTIRTPGEFIMSLRNKTE